MKSGDVFTIDAQAVKETADFLQVTEKSLTNKVEEGFVFSVAKGEDCTSEAAIRASRWENGKPRKGRPRRFARATVARLLGETDDVSLNRPSVEEEVETFNKVETEDLEAHATSLLSQEETVEANADSPPW